MPRTTLLWFREDLRLHDNPALSEAAQRGNRLLPVYLHTPQESAPWQSGGASHWWLHHSLCALDESLRQAGSGLVIRSGESALALLQQLIAESGADGVYWNRLYTPAAVARDAQIESVLNADGIEVNSHRAGLLFEPASIHKDNGEPYRVFTAFWKRCQAHSLYQPLCTAPERLPALPAGIAGSTPAALGLLPQIPWDQGFADCWQPGEAGAQKQAERFFTTDLYDYEQQRDLPASPGTSQLSAHLHFGEISPRALINRAVAQLDCAASASARQSVQRFMAELGWREFAAHILFHFPDSCTDSMDARFGRFPWREDPHALRRWQQGRSGFPIIDAGMRQLWQCGWMHNRVRMLVASFLTKNLRQHWLHGARWFWDTLVDADLASNSLGWQWVAGCGTDAAPYFRIFNPVLQGKKFDPQGEYIRRWVPELAALDSRFIHEPWKCSHGCDYPQPMIDLADSRQQALAAFQSLRTAPAATAGSTRRR